MRRYGIATVCLVLLLTVGCAMSAEIRLPTPARIKPSISEKALKRLNIAKPITAATAPSLKLVWHAPISANTVQQIWPMAVDSADFGRIFTCHVEKIAGTSATRSVLRAVSVQDGTELWNITTTSSGSGFQNPICVEGKLLAGMGTRMQAHDPATGTVLWDTATPGGACWSWGNIVNGVIYHSAPGKYSALQIATGAYLWSNPTGNSPGAPMASGSLLYLATESGLKMMSAGTGGNPKWTMSTPCSWSTPLVRGKTVYCTGPSHVSAVDSAGGTVIWKKTMHADASPSNAYPLLSTRNAMCVLTDDQKLVCCDPKVGTERWRCDAQSVRGIRPLPVVNDVIFLPGKTLTAVDGVTGAQLWRYDVGKPDGFTSAALVNDNILVAQFGPELYVFAAM